MLESKLETVCEAQGQPVKSEMNKTGMKKAKHKQIVPKGIRQNYELNKFVRENDALVEFYKRQQIIPEDEWTHFQSSLISELPSSFRIQRNLREKDCLAEYLEQKFIKEIKSIEDNEGIEGGIHPPKPIPFVPYAYQTKMCRAAIRRHPILKEFHQFLVNETELGNISRQEACSMIPPLLLDIQPNQKVLDACAAPGSKTMQIIELMHENSPNPEGIVVANDNDYKRCYLLVRQTLKRMPTANVVVVCHDAAQFPTILDAQHRPVLFDRILCDVICSGDGTLRKNPELWKSWDPMKGVNLHKLQLQIAIRCLDLLKEGGLMAYSTCSLNPLEDEAVIAHLLRRFEGKVELVDVADRLVDLKISPGVTKWKVFDKHLNELDSVESAQSEAKRFFKPSMFPPTTSEAEKMHLERSFRILPHSQDSGGFFVAVLRKIKPSKQEMFDQNCDANRCMSKRLIPAKRPRFENKEDPFTFLEENDKDNRQFIDDLDMHFGISPHHFPHSNLLVRSNNTERKKEIYFVNDAIRDFLKLNGKRFRIVNAGVGVLKRIVSDKVALCPYRLKQDGLKFLLPFITKRIIDIPVEALVKILKGNVTIGEQIGDEKHEEKSQYLNMAELHDYEALFKDIATGSIVLRFRSGSLQKEMCAWKGPNSVSAFVSREEKLHILSLLGEDTSNLLRTNDTTRREKARRQFDNDNTEKDEKTMEESVEN